MILENNKKMEECGCGESIDKTYKCNDCGECIYDCDYCDEKMYSCDICDDYNRKYCENCRYGFLECCFNNCDRLFCNNCVFGWVKSGENFECDDCLGEIFKYKDKNLENLEEENKLLKIRVNKYKKFWLRTIKKEKTKK